jgi:hypothetical protein
MTGQNTEFSVGSHTLNSPGSGNEDSSYTPDFDKWNGYYRAIPEAKSIIDTLERWIFGKGFKGKDVSKLKRIVGNGKENARRVIRNTWRISRICGDGFAEIIKDNQGRITNLKALNSQTIKIVYTSAGILKHYEQTTTNTIFQPDEILHFSHQRTGDEMGGISLFEALENIMLSRNEVVADLRTLFHRFVKPINIYEADTDNTTELATLAGQINKAYKYSENMIVPKGSFNKVQTEITSTQTGNLSPLEYYKLLIRLFITSCGVPELIMGWSSDTTEASAKIVYLAWEQTIEDEQLNIEEDLEDQLNIKINLEFPATIEEELLKDKKKDGPMQGEKKSEVKAEL